MNDIDDDWVRNMPGMVELIEKHQDFIRDCGYADAPLIDQYNIVWSLQKELDEP